MGQEGLKMNQAFIVKVQKKYYQKKTVTETVASETARNMNEKKIALIKILEHI